MDDAIDNQTKNQEYQYDVCFLHCHIFSKTLYKY